MPSPLNLAVHRYFREVWNERREDSLFELLSPDFLIHGLTDQPLDLQGYVYAWNGFQDTLSNLNVQVDDIVEQPDKVAVRVTISGDHVGEGFGIPPTGKRISFGAQIISTWDGKCFTEAWNVIDMAAALRQLTED